MKGIISISLILLLSLFYLSGCGDSSSGVVYVPSPTVNITVKIGGTVLNNNVAVLGAYVRLYLETG